MFTSADLIEVLRRRRRRSIRPEAAVDGLPPGWTAWLSAMRVRADAVTGATATAIIELLAARPPVPRTRLPVPANRFQAWAGLRYPLWEPPPRDQRGLRRWSFGASLVVQIVWITLLFGLMNARFLAADAPAALGEEHVVQAVFIGTGTPDDAGGGAPPDGTAPEETTATLPTPAAATPPVAAAPSATIPPPSVEPVSETAAAAPDGDAAAAQVLGERWTAGLAIWALPAVLALLIWLRLPNQPEAASESGAGLPWKEPRAWLLSIYFALQAGLFYALATWLVARYHEVGYSLLQSNAFFSGFMLIGLPSAFAMPWLAQRLGNRHRIMATCGVLATLCLALIALRPGWQPLVVCMLLGVALNGTFSLALISPMYEAGTPLAVSRLTAMMLCTGYCLACLTPVLAGLGRDLAGDYRMPFLVLTGMAACMSLLAMRLRPRHVDR